MLIVRDVLMDHRHRLVHPQVALVNPATAVLARARTALVRDANAAKVQVVGVTKPDVPRVVAPNPVVAPEVPVVHLIVQVRKARAKVLEAEPVPVARSLVVALAHQPRHRADLIHHQVVVNAGHTEVVHPVAHLVPPDHLVLIDHLVLADHLVPVDRAVAAEHSQAVARSRVVAVHAANLVQPADPELAVDHSAAVVHAPAVVAQGNPEPVALHMEESLNLVAPAVHPAAVAMTEVVSLNAE
jgi:hypothetical protein